MQNPLIVSISKRGGGFCSSLRYNRTAFTLAEVLITLGIIGIVAAMTLPQLIKNYQGKVLESQFKKSYNIAQQVVLAAKANVGVGNFTEFCTDYNGSEYTNNETCYKALTKAWIGKEIDTTYKYDSQYQIKRTDEIRTYNNRQEATKSAIAGFGNLWQVYKNKDGTLMQYSIIEHKLYITVDTNGLKKPNKLGHDIFVMYTDKQDRVVGNKQSKLYTDEELDGMEFDTEYSKERAGNPCSAKSNQKANGIGCSWYAIADINPDTGENGYWKTLP